MASLTDILRTLEMYSQTEVPANVRADIERWSKQIERLTLEADQGRLFLRSDNPLVITVVWGRHTLGVFVTHQVDATTLELRADTYPEVVQTFDACHYSVLDRVQEGWNTSAPPAAASQGHGRRPLRLDGHVKTGHGPLPRSAGSMRIGPQTARPSTPSPAMPTSPAMSSIACSRQA
jgi:hypothetical protein